MDAAPLLFLTFIALIFVLGILSIFLSNYLRVSRVIFFIAIGMVLSLLGLFDLSPVFILAIAALAISLVVFESSSKLKLNLSDKLSFKALKLTLAILILNIVFFAAALFLYDATSNIWYVIILSLLMLGTDMTSLTLVSKGVDAKILEFLEKESIINTFFVVLTPFIALTLTKTFSQRSDILQQVYPFLQQIMLSVGIAVVIGIIMMNALRKSYNESWTPIFMITSLVLSYILAQSIGANGIITVAIIGFFFGAAYLKDKEHISEFSSLFSGSLEIVVLILAGLLVKIPFTINFILGSLVLFVFFVLIRLLAAMISLQDMFTLGEKLFIGLNMEKGLVVGAIILALSTMNIPNFEPVLQISVLFMAYSIVLSVIVVRLPFFSSRSSRPVIAKKHSKKR